MNVQLHDGYYKVTRSGWSIHIDYYEVYEVIHDLSRGQTYLMAATEDVEGDQRGYRFDEDMLIPANAPDADALVAAQVFRLRKELTEERAAVRACEALPEDAAVLVRQELTRFADRQARPVVTPETEPFWDCPEMVDGVERYEPSALGLALLRAMGRS